MALLRLGTLGLAALAACGQAGAQPAVTSGITPPAGWRALPELASSVAEATKAPGVTVEGTEAWGEPARGCYAVWFELRGSGATAEAILAGLAAEKLATTNVVKPESGDGIVALSFAAPPYTGRLRARTADGAVTALACFANQREPATCESPCTQLLGAIR